MNIYEFFNSRDIAEHCQKIGKEWTPFEMAVIIGRSKRSIADKHKAWRTLITDYPDMATPKSYEHDSYESLHKILAAQIELEENLLLLFMKQETDAVYMHIVMWDGRERYSETVFTSYEKVLADLKESWTPDEAPKIKIIKDYTNDNGKIEIITDYDGSIHELNILCRDECDERIPEDYDIRIFDCPSYYMDFPMPFKLGDILTIRLNPPDKDDRVFILEPLHPNWKQPFCRSIEKSDYTDMMDWGYFVSDEGVLYGGHTPWPDYFEYYHGKLKEKDKLLHYVSLYLKGEIRLPELMVMQCRNILEYQMEYNLDYQNHGCFITDKQLAENVIINEEKSEQETT